MQKSKYDRLMTYYKYAMENIEKNPDSAVNNARKAAESVCKGIINGAGKEFGSKATIESLLAQIKNSKIAIDPKIELAARTIQLYSNYGAHDQGYQSHIASSVIEHYDDLSSEDIIPCMDALTQMIKHILKDSMSSDLTDNTHKQSILSLPESYTIKIGTSILTVPDSIMQGWKCEEVFSKINMSVQRIPRKWNDQILSDLADNTLDIAIYNRESALHYLKQHPEKRFHITRDVCSSMGGRNFYVLASAKGKWKDMTLNEFKQALGKDTIFAVSKNSDMEKNLLFILDKTMDELNELGVRIFDYHSDQGLSIFDLNQDILVIGGQDLRFLAESTGEYFEVISYDDLPLEKRECFDRSSVNSLIVGPAFFDMMGSELLDNISNQLMINFYSSNISKDSKKRIRDRLRPQVRQICPDDETADYVIQRILFETYRFF